MATRVERNLAALSGLHPRFRSLADLLLVRLDALGMAPLITQGWRTMAEQAALYAQGRSMPGEIVTNAVPGKSYHNYGLAIDLVDVAASGERDSYEIEDYDKTDYMLIAREAVALGLCPGARWKHADKPHVEFHPGMTCHDAISLLGLADKAGHLPDGLFDRS